jgi:6-phosphogluconolactonase
MNIFTASAVQGRRRLHKLSILLLILVTILIRAIPAEGATNGQYLVYIGTYTDQDSKGIYAYRLDSKTGRTTALGLAAESENPSFLAVSPNGKFLYAANELDSYQGKPTGAISAFAIDSGTAKLSLLNQVSSHDQGPAHIGLDQSGRFAFVSNYSLGSVAVFLVLKDGRLGELSWFVQHHGSSVNQQWQQGPHVHEVVLSPDNRFALVADPGIDQVLVYPFDAAAGKLGTEPFIAHAHPGSAPRHLVFDGGPKFVYVISELSSSVTTYSYDPAGGELREVQTISTLPQGFAETSYGAEIAVHPSGKFLYASNRGHDSIAAFSVDPAKSTLSHIEFVKTNGKRPRSFALDPTGSWLWVANQDSGNIVIFRVNQKTGRLTPTGQTFPAPSPACVAFVPLP